MATVYISEYSSPAFSAGNLGIAAEPSNTEQTLPIVATSTASTAFRNNTFFIRVHADAVCSIAIASAPVAAATTKRMAANQTEYFAVAPGQKLAAITNS